MKNTKILLLAAVCGLFLTVACDDDPPAPNDAMISSITASGTSFEDGSTVTADLNGAASAEDVALNSVITIVLDKEIDPATASASNITLTANGEAVGIDVNTTTSQVVITPQGDMQRGTAHTLTITGIMAADGGGFTTASRTFTTEGRAPVVVPNADNQLLYFSFDGSTADAMGSYTVDNVIDVEYGPDRFGQGNSSAVFDGNTSLIEVANGADLMAGDDFTASFWMKTNSADHVNAEGNPAGMFVFGLAAFEGFQFEIPADFGSCKLAMSYTNGDEFLSEDLWFPGNGQDRDNGGWQGWDFVANLEASGGVAGLIKDQWVHIVCTYDAASKVGQMYINGELMKSQDFNLWPDGTPWQSISGVAYDETAVEPTWEKILAIGFIKSADSQEWADTPWGDYYKPTANHYKGDLDDIRFFDASFTSSDVEALYNAEKP